MCGDGFTGTTAQTICKFLGFPKGGRPKYNCASPSDYGGCEPNEEGKGPIWLEQLSCLGFERDLAGCSHKPWGEHSCEHSGDVSVCCLGKQGEVRLPRPSASGKLVFKFSDSLDSSTGGPGLHAPWGLGKFSETDGYVFREGEGLAFDPYGYIGPNEWTFIFRLKLDKSYGCGRNGCSHPFPHMRCHIHDLSRMHRWRNLLYSSGWGMAGIFVNRFFQVYGNDDMVCDEPIMPNQWYYYAMSRASSGEVKLYLNGYL